ncbi:hypothetical protein RRG08_015243 [Elysia crispata]|uniref:Uncharacterized protein n=1 Tax=Elysia crispata TaxID=231223 RepID=A0AAE0YZM9_9GAST|nr:hypothetical protein RRG08_015243 [Elysia crispata]
MPTFPPRRPPSAPTGQKEDAKGDFASKTPDDLEGAKPCLKVPPHHRFPPPTGGSFVHKGFSSPPHADHAPPSPKAPSAPDRAKRRIPKGSKFKVSPWGNIPPNPSRRSATRFASGRLFRRIPRDTTPVTACLISGGEGSSPPDQGRRFPSLLNPLTTRLPDGRPPPKRPEAPGRGNVVARGLKPRRRNPPTTFSSEGETINRFEGGEAPVCPWQVSGFITFEGGLGPPIHLEMWRKAPPWCQGQTGASPPSNKERKDPPFPPKGQNAPKPSLREGFGGRFTFFEGAKPPLHQGVRRTSSKVG